MRGEGQPVQLEWSYAREKPLLVLVSCKELGFRLASRGANVASLLLDRKVSVHTKSSVFGEPEF